jgi:tripartite-type tricarboxylate transporter receptor subunit TctC
LLAGVLLLAAAAGQAQTYPAKPVRLIIGLPPGGLIDTLARGVATELARIWGQPVIVENRPGGTDTIAATAVARSAPDGYTIYLTTSTNMNTAQFLRRNLPYDPVRDFIPVVGLTQTQEILTVNNRLPVANVHEFVAYARARPGELNYGSFGIASAGHLEAEAFASVTGTRFTHVPYKGVADLMRALVAGEVDFAWTGMTNAIPLVKQGQVKAMVYTGKKRSRALPQVPTLAEAGYEFDAGGLISLYVPAGTPKAIVERIAADASQARENPAFRERYIFGNGMEDFPVQGAELAARLQQSREAYGSRVKGLDIKLE